MQQMGEDMLFLFVLILLHGADGAAIEVNPDQITSLRGPREGVTEHDRMYHKATNCLINLADGKAVAVIETCEVVQQMIEGNKPRVETEGNKLPVESKPPVDHVEPQR